MFTKRIVQAVCLASLLMTPLAAISQAAGTELPVVSEHRYRMLAKVRPLLFWISKDDVGGAKVSWRGSEDGGFGLDLLIGSDPRRAPRQINKWGYIAEQVRGSTPASPGDEAVERAARWRTPRRPAPKAKAATSSRRFRTAS
jgi:hypothetical protein